MSGACRAQILIRRREPQHFPRWPTKDFRRLHVTIIGTMGPAPPSGGVLWFFATTTGLQGVDSIKEDDYCGLLLDATQPERSYSAVTHWEHFHPVRILTCSHTGEDRGAALPAGSPGGDDVCSVYQYHNWSHWCRTAVSAYEDSVAAVCGSHVYVSPLMCFDNTFRGHSGTSRLAEYVRLALEDEKNEHVLPLREVPEVPKLISFPETIVSVACGAEHLLLCSNVGRLYSMGSNRHGQLGRGARSPGIISLGIVHLVEETPNDRSRVSCSPAAVAVYAGSNFSFAIARKRSVLTRPSSPGLSRCTARLLGAEPSSSTRSNEASSAARSKKIKTWCESATTDVQGIALPCRADDATLGSELGHSSDNGKGDTLYSWGCNDYGQLGHGTKEAALRPVQVEQPNGVATWSSVAAGFAHVVVLTGTGTVYACGLNLHGQLGLETTREETSLCKINLSEPVEQISCGTWHTLLLTSNGRLLTAGRPPEFQYAAWLQCAASPAETRSMGPICARRAQERNAAVQEVTSLPGLPPKGSVCQIQPAAPATTFLDKTGPLTLGTSLLSSTRRMLLSTTRHVCDSLYYVSTRAQPGSSNSLQRSGCLSTDNIPFAHAPNILRITGFRERLKCVSAGQTTSAAVGINKNTKRYRLYVWNPAEARGSSDNWMLLCDVYDLAPLLKSAGGTEGTTVACRCAASGIYLWAASL